MNEMSSCLWKSEFSGCVSLFSCLDSAGVRAAEGRHHFLHTLSARRTGFCSSLSLEVKSSGGDLTRSGILVLSLTISQFPDW